MDKRGSENIKVINSDGIDAGVSLNALRLNSELIIALAMRAIRSRFRGTKLGLLWGFVQPLIYMIVINLFFGLVLRFDSGDTPYPLHLLSGIVAFQFFTKGLGEGANAIGGNQGILTKIYIPPIVFPAASIISGLVDFVFPVLLLIGFLIYYQVPLSSNLFFLPVILIFLFALFAASQFFLSVVAVRWKDVRMVVPVVSQLMFFGTPIFYPLSMVPEKYQVFFALNPMVGIVEAIRWCVLGKGQLPSIAILIVSGMVVFLSCILAAYTFRKLGRNLCNFVG